MSRAKAIILASVAAIVLCAAVLTILVLTPIDDRHYGRIVTWASKHFAGLQVTMEGPFLVALSSEPFITASKIRIRDISRPAAHTTVEIGRLEIKVAILPLLSRAVLIRHLLIDDATVSIVHRKRARPGASEPDKRPSHLLIPVFESVSLRNVHLTVGDENETELVRLVLEDYSLKDDGDGGPLYMEGEGALNDREFEIEGKLGSLADMLKGDEPYPVDLRANTAGLALTVSGTIDDPMHGQGLNMRVVAEAGEMANLLRIFKADFPNLGQLSLDSKIVGDASSPGLADIQLAVSRGSDFNLAAKGSIGDMLTGRGTSLQVSGSCTSKDILQMLLPEGLPEILRLKWEGRIRDGDGVYVVESLKLSGSNEQGTTMKADGTMGFSRAIGKVPAFRELDLNCRLSSPTTTSAKFPAVDFLPELGAMSAMGRVRFSEDLLRLEDLAVRSSHAQGLQVETAGAVQVPLDEAKDRYVKIDLQVRVTAPNMGAAKPLLGIQYLSSSGPLLGKGRITGTSEALSIEDLSITVGESGPVRARWQGRIGRVPLSSDELPSDVDIVGSIDADEASALAFLAAISLPNLGPLKTTFRFVEQEGVYRFKDIQLSMGSQEGLWLKGGGSVDFIMKGGAISLSGLDAEVAASAPSLAAIPRAADLDLPDLRPMALKARIIDRNGRLDILDIESFELDAGTEKGAFLQIQGQASGLRGGDQKVVEASFKTASKPWVMKLLKDSAPKNHVIEGKLRIAGTPKHIRIEELEVETTGPKRLYLEADGTVKKMKGVFETDIRFTAGSKNPSVIGSILGISLPSFSPLAVKGRIIRNDRKTDLEGEMHLGKTHFKTVFNHSTGNYSPKTSIKISSPSVYLKDLGVYPRYVATESERSETSRKTTDRLFSEKPLTFDALKGRNLSLSMDVEKLIARDSIINNLDFDLSLDNGLLRISPARLSYANGEISFESSLDITGEIPEVILKVTAEDVDMDALLAHINRPIILGGHLSLAVDLHGAGNSLHEIASSLNGDFSSAIENGRIKRDVEMLTSDAVDLVTALPKIRTYQDLKCLVLRFVFADGVGKSEIMFLDTPNVRSRGAGTIDLTSETMDFVVQPKPKKGLPGFSSAVRIYGPLTNPKARKMPFKEAARLYGEIFMPHLFLPARAMGYLWYLMKNDKDEQSPCLEMQPMNE